MCARTGKREQAEGSAGASWGGASRACWRWRGTRCVAVRQSIDLFDAHECRPYQTWAKRIEKWARKGRVVATRHGGRRRWGGRRAVDGDEEGDADVGYTCECVREGGECGDLAAWRECGRGYAKQHTSTGSNPAGTGMGAQREDYPYPQRQGAAGGGRRRKKKKVPGQLKATRLVARPGPGGTGACASRVTADRCSGHGRAGARQGYIRNRFCRVGTAARRDRRAHAAAEGEGAFGGLGGPGRPLRAGGVLSRHQRPSPRSVAAGGDRSRHRIVYLARPLFQVFPARQVSCAAGGGGGALQVRRQGGCRGGRRAARGAAG